MTSITWYQKTGIATEKDCFCLYATLVSQLAYKEASSLLMKHLDARVQAIL